MREKIWKDCPICGAKNSMQSRKNVTEKIDLRSYPSITLSGLSGQFCNKCGDGFWSLESERYMEQMLGEHMAKQDSDRVVASDLASVQEAAQALHVTTQAVHRMMIDGRLRYVFVAGKRYPVRSDISRVQELRQAIAA